MGVYVKTSSGADKLENSYAGQKAIIVYKGYHNLTYSSTTWLKTTIVKGTIDSNVFKNDTAPVVLITPRFHSGMPYRQITGYGYEINMSAETITLEAFGSGFVSGHVQGLNVAVLANV